MQDREIALGQEIEARRPGLHRRIEAVALLELDRQAFGEIARAHARRIEALHDAEHRLDLGDGGAELFGDRRKIAAEIAGLVDEIDEILADHAPRRVGDRKRKLLAQPVRQRGLGGDEGFEIVVAVLAAAGADCRPFGIAGRKL